MGSELDEMIAFFLSLRNSSNVTIQGPILKSSSFTDTPLCFSLKGRESIHLVIRTVSVETERKSAQSLLFIDRLDAITRAVYSSFL